MSPIWNRAMRKVHRWGAVIVLVPLVFVIGTGLLLQVKKQVPWVQPPTLRGSGTTPLITWDQLLALAQAVPEAAVAGWADIERIDIQPNRGIAKVICANRWELQIDTSSSDILSSTYRRSDLIETLHDGSFFGDWVKLGIFLPTGCILLALWVTGAYLWILPFWVRFRKGRLGWRHRRPQ